MKNFKEFASGFVQTVCVLTILKNNGIEGCTISSFSSVSSNSHESFISFALSAKSYMASNIEVMDRIQIRVLKQSQKQLAAHFVQFRDIPDDQELIEMFKNPLSGLKAVVLYKIAVSDSFLYVCKVSETDIFDTAAKPLTYFKRSFNSD